MAQQDRKNPRTMVNKFDSTCGDCSREVVKGETILYHGRGYIQCNDCAPVNSTPSKPASNAQAWQDALAWDNSEPDKGASIGGTDTAVVTPIKKTIDAQYVVDDHQKRVDNPVHPVQPEKVIDDPLDSLSGTDRAEALTTELLIILVNAIDVAGISGRHGLQAFCKENAGRSIDHSTRQHLWRGIGQAIQQS
jgi:hypothetical protein